MRLDDAPPRTWLLAAVAGWAVLLWLLALAGMGGRIAPLPDGALQAPALPTLAPAAAQRLGPADAYAGIGDRPLLSETRRPQPFTLATGSDDAPAQEHFEYVLTGVLLTPGLQMAILQPAAGGDSVRLRVGEAPPDAPSWRLASLSPRGAVFAGPSGDRTLELRTYDGGADLRTAMPAPRPAPASPNHPATVAADMTAEGAPAVEEAGAASPEAQMDAIRRRIEARREQLRREARQPPPPPPPPTQQR